MMLSEIKNGNTFNIGNYKLIKFSDNDGKSIVVFADTVFDERFGDDNNFSKSKILKRLNDEILPEIIKVVGEDNVLEFETDLTSLDGLKTHGTMKSKISIPTFDFYRNNVHIFDEYKIPKYWWLATPDTTSEHYNNRWIVCVSPVGIMNIDYYYDDYGVRPILIFNSSISVSCEE